MTWKGRQYRWKKGGKVWFVTGNKEGVCARSYRVIKGDKGHRKEDDIGTFIERDRESELHMKISWPRRVLAQNHFFLDRWLHDRTEYIDLESIHAIGGKVIFWS